MTVKLQRTSFLHNISSLKPTINEIGFDMHYNRIYEEYVEKFNNGEGDIVFNKAGADLHALYFENIREYREQNLPTGRVYNIIERRYGNTDNFIKTIFDTADKLQGNGWIFMNTSGFLNIIPNNRHVNNLAMIIDMWEHAYILNHGHNRDEYLRNHLHIIDWNVVNHRIENPKKPEQTSQRLTKE